MTDLDLERIRQKIDAGEKLSANELERLSHAARVENSLSLRLAMAQALLNQDEVSAALPLLQRLARDFPREVQVALAQARASVLQEKWADAEPHVRRALELNPGDLEAVKVLAVIATRRGEFDRARALVDEVLERDPFDPEAQALSAELNSGGTLAPPPPEAPTRPRDPVQLGAFTTALVERLKAQGTPVLQQHDAVLVRLGQGGFARLDLGSLYDEFMDSGRPLAEAVEGIARAVSERALGVPRGKLQLLQRALPVVRDGGFLEQAQGSLQREGPAGLFIFYVLEDKELMRYLPASVLTSHRLALDTLDAAAWRNLERLPATVRAIALGNGQLQFSPTPTGLWCIGQGDGHDAARVLTPLHQQRLFETVGEGPWRVYLGLRELVLVCREADKPWADELARLQPARGGIGGVFRLEGAKLTQLGEWG